MIRLFVAIRPPAPVRSALRSIMDDIDGARWQNDDQLHITLRFVGHLDEDQAKDVAAALYTLRYHKFEIGIDGIGYFERKGRVEEVWAKVAPEGAIAMLAAKIERLCQQCGLPPIYQAYRPHVTLARLNKSSGPVTSFIKDNAGLNLPPFEVDQFGLYMSELGKTAASYTLVSRYLLD